MDNYRVFYERYREPLLGHLVRWSGDADLSLDILQESFTRYLQHYRQGELRAALLFRIARNALNDHFRKRRGECELEAAYLPADTDVEHSVIVREEYRQVLALMQQLGPNERELLSLVLTRHLSYREIAATTEISEANVKVIIHRARKKLRRLLKGDAA